MEEVAFSVREIIPKTTTLRVRLTGVRTWAIRLKLGRGLLWLAAHIIGMSMQVEVDN